MESEKRRTSTKASNRTKFFLQIIAECVEILLFYSNIQENFHTAQFKSKMPCQLPPVSSGTCQFSKISNIIKMLHMIYQSTQNFTLIPKMYNFIGLSCVFFELWPFEDWKRPNLKILDKKDLFQSLNGHNSKTTEDRPKKLYIFGISVKFCVDWYTIWSIFIIFIITWITAQLNSLKMALLTKSYLFLGTRANLLLHMQHRNYLYSNVYACFHQPDRGKKIEDRSWVVLFSYIL